MYIKQTVFRENALSAELYSEKFINDFKSALTTLEIEFTHTKFDSIKTLSNVSVCQTLNLPLWIQKVVTGVRVKGTSAMSSSYLGKGECNEVLYFSVHGVNYFIGLSYVSNCSNAIFGSINGGDKNPTYAQWHNYRDGDFYQDSVSINWFGIRNHYTNIVLVKSQNSFYMTFTTSRDYGNTATQLNYGTALITGVQNNVLNLIDNSVADITWDTSIVGSNVSLASSSSTFSKYYGLKGDLIINKYPIFETYIGVDGGGLLGKVTDLVTIPYNSQKWGEVININGQLYVSTGGYYLKC